MRQRLYVFVAIAVVALSGAVLAANEVRLRINAKPGDSWVYKVTVNNEGVMKSAQGAQPMRTAMTMTYRMTVQKKLPNGDYVIKAQPSVPKMTANGREMSTGQQGTPKAITYILSPNGRIRSAEGGGAEMTSVGDLMAAGFPSKPVKVGETWKVEKEISVSGGPKMKVTSQNKLVALTGKTAKVLTTFSTPIESESGGSKMKGTMQGAVTSELLLSSGMVKTADGKLKMKARMTMPQPPSGQQAGPRGPSSMDMEMNISLKVAMVSGK